jgi:hypothetical protein
MIASHVWGEGSFDIKVKAKDVYNNEIDWLDPLSVTMSRNKPYTDIRLLIFLQNIIARFPFFARLLKLP